MNNYDLPRRRPASPNRRPGSRWHIRSKPQMQTAIRAMVARHGGQLALRRALLGVRGCGMGQSTISKLLHGLADGIDGVNARALQEVAAEDERALLDAALLSPEDAGNEQRYIRWLAKALNGLGDQVTKADIRGEIRVKVRKDLGPQVAHLTSLLRQRGNKHILKFLEGVPAQFKADRKGMYRVNLALWTAMAPLCQPYIFHRLRASPERDQYLDLALRAQMVLLSFEATSWPERHPSSESP